MRILFLLNDEDILSIWRVLYSEGCEVDTAYTAGEGLNLARAAAPI